MKGISFMIFILGIRVRYIHFQDMNRQKWFIDVNQQKFTKIAMASIL